jgi:aryl-alcohol dehydrogenase-like predicted oxidoreductase
VIATKGGIHYGPDGKQAQDARPETLARECDESLQRLGVEQVELYYLHSPDPNVPIAESAGAIQRLVDAGKTLSGGVELLPRTTKGVPRRLPAEARCSCHNMLQRDIEKKRSVVPRGESPSRPIGC